MFFQYSPVLKDHKPKNNENREENDEVTHLSLAPFTTNPKIDFDVKVGTVVTKKLLIMNPTGKDFNIKITSTIPEDLHFSLSWTNSFIAKGQTVILDLVWEPIKEESSRYSLLFSDGRMRRTVFLTFKSVALTKKLKKNGKGKTPPKKQPFFRTSPRRKLPSGLKYTLPKVLITSPASSCERETFIINKENIPQIDGRETYTINEIPSIKRSKPNMDFDDSLENAAENIFVEEQNNFETKLRTLTFDLTPIKTPFIPNDSSTVTKESLNFTSTTYVKDNSFEMHIKSNNSFENYVKQNFSSGTFVKDSSIADLSNFSVMSDFKTPCNNKHLIPINEELSNSVILSNRKRKSSEIILEALPKKRLSLEQFRNTNTVISPNVLYYNIDPFMNGHLFNAHYILQQQTYLEKWLNALLTPPTELDAITEIDVAKIWQECKTTSIDVAPTKESVSFNYHTNNKLNILRLKARQFYKQPDIVEVLRKISNLIDLERLSIRKDKEIHLNLTLKGYLTKLILSYNPLWLRIGLETIYNENILLLSNSDIKGLTHFLLERLFKCPFLLKKYKTIYSNKYLNDLNKFFLKKILSLIYFLDRAKIERLIQHDPCLFCRNSTIKSSRDVLLNLSREILASMGDFTKYLKLNGYVVFHSQTYLNEFQYAVTSLGMDLRDGVRLVRLLEIILLRDNLSQQLRVPAVSRLQKVHNMNIVFQTLNDAGFKILYEINPKDIVDGHKEKTLSFLWQIVHKFQTPLMEKKAGIIQCWYRSLKIVIKRRQLQRLYEKRKRAVLIIEKWYKCIKLVKKINLFLNYWIELRRNRAALKIQTHFRMYICFKKYNKYRNLIVNIQAYAKGWLLRNYYQKRIKAAIYLQRKYRAMILMRNVREYYLNLQKVVEKIQSIFRTNQQRQLFIMLRTKTIFVQRRFKANKLMKMQRAEFLKQKEAVIRIQRWYKAKRAMIQQRTQYCVMKQITVKIQATFRAKKQRQIFLSLKSSTIFIQRLFRANQSMKIQRAEFLKQKQASLRIQCWYKAKRAMIQQRTQYCIMKQITIKIQATFRAKKQRQIFLSLKSSTIFVQRLFRANQLMKTQRAEFLKQKEAVIQIQRWYKAKRAMIQQRTQYCVMKQITVKIQATFRAKKQRQIFLSLKSSTIFIQRLFRANQSMKIQRAEFLKQKQASLRIQCWYKAKRAMIQQRTQYCIMKQITIKIQATFRAKKQRQIFLSLKSSTIFVQRLFRANQLMKIQRAEFLKQKEAVIRIQRWYKAKRAMIQQRTQYCVMKQITVKIQATFRAKKQRQIFLSLKSSTIFIQRLFRANQSMKIQRAEFLKQKQASLRIQCWYKAKRAMIQQRTQYCIMKQITIKIQATFRAKKQRQIFLSLKSSTIFIQRLFRANQLMKIQRTEFLKQKEAVIRIQRWYKAKRAMIQQRTQYCIMKQITIKIQATFRAKKQRQIFLSLKSSTIFVQRLFRANQLMKIQRAEFLKQKQASLRIQCWYKAKRAMIQQRTQYCIMKQITIKIQATFRAKKQRQIFLSLKSSTIFIQRLFRANQLMKIQRTEFLKQKEAVIRIQRWYKAKRAMIQQRTQYCVMKQITVKIQAIFRAKKQRQIFLSLKSSTIFIQRLFRANQSMKIQRAEFLKQKQASLRIQCWYKAQKAMILHRDQYIQLRAAVITIQNRFRAQYLMKIQRQQFITLKAATILIQRKFRANQEHKRFIKQKKCIVQLQRYCRGYLIRFKYKYYLSEEGRKQRKIENERKNAAIKIQACYRGYRQRKQSDPTLIEISKRVRAAYNNFKVENTLGYCMEHSLTTIIHEFSTISQIIAALKQFEFITRRSAIICNKTADHMPQQLYMLLNATIRSLPEAEVCTWAAKILVNYCKLESTREKSFIKEYISDTVTVMLHWCDKDNEVFISLCTLLWLFGHVNEWKNVICDLPNIKKRFEKIETLCKRKQLMVLKTGVKSVITYFGPYKKLPLPTTTPDWGLDYKHKPHLFTHALHAFYSLNNILFN